MSSLELDWESGKLANLDHVARATMSTPGTGPSSTYRALDITIMGGINIRVLPDRGYDIGSAWFGGVPLAWISAVGGSPPLASPSGTEWLSAFGGGLITTCGLRNVGLPSEGHGLHGSFSHQKSSEISVRRRFDRGRLRVDVSAVIHEPSGPRSLFRVRRRISVWTGIGQLELVDETTNLGLETEPAPVLYHVNLGYPLIDEGTTIRCSGDEIIPRDTDAESQLRFASEVGRPVPDVAEAVFERRVRSDATDWCRASVESARSDLSLMLSWRHLELPRFHEWVRRSAHWYVVGLEPANCSVMGREFDRARGSLPLLEPGSTRETRLRADGRTGAGR